jgi:adenylate cyclase
VRLTLLYGIVVFAVLVVMSVAFYKFAVEGQVEGLRGRLRDTAVAIATGITAEQLAPLTDSTMQDSPPHKALVGRLRNVASVDLEISDIYVMRPAPLPSAQRRLVILADYVVRADREAGKVGEEYIPAPHIKMLQGLERPTVEDGPYTDAWGTVISGYAPIRDASGKAIALVGIDVQFASVTAMKERIRNIALLLFLGSVIALVILARVVAIRVREPLQRIVEASSAISSGLPHVRAEIERKDEFGVVGRHFDVMASGLQERDFIKTTFGTYVSPALVKRVLEERTSTVAGTQRDVVVLFSDLRSFTTISEKLSPEDVVLMLNDYLERMSKAVVAAGGRIDKFIGDALMVDWGTLEKIEDPEGSALRAALDMQRALTALNKERAARGEVALSMGIGVHTGPVIAGSIGSQRKLEFTVIGDAVNIASRLEGLCKLYGVDIIASRAVVTASVKKHPYRRIDRAIVAGKSEPIDLVEVLDETDPRVARIEIYERGMVALYDRNWDDAVAAFREAADGIDDPLATFQIGRASALRANSQAASTWDGIERRAK